MEVHFPPDIETRLQQVALANAKDAGQLVNDTVARMLENQARFVAGVEKGIEQADRGKLIDHKDVVTRIAIFPREKQLSNGDQETQPACAMPLVHSF